MPQNQAADNFQTTLAAAATSSQTTLELTTITGAPSYPYLLALSPAGGSVPYSSFEVVQVTSLASGTTVNVTRGVEGTAAAWSSGDTATNAFTAGDANGLAQANWPIDFTGSWVVARSMNAGITVSGSGSSTPSSSWTTQVQLNTGATSSSSAVAQLLDTITSGIMFSDIGNGAAMACRFKIGALPAASGDEVDIGMYDAGNLQMYLKIAYATSLTTSLYNNGTAGPGASSVQISDTNAHVFVMYTKGSTTYFYLDGTLIGSVDNGYNSPVGNHAPFWCRVINGGASTTDVSITVDGPVLVQGWP